VHVVTRRVRKAENGVIIEKKTEGGIVYKSLSPEIKTQEHLVLKKKH